MIFKLMLCIFVVLRTPGPVQGHLIYQIIGCFGDSNYVRDLNGTQFLSGTSMTPPTCFNFCQAMNFRYAGVQFTLQCLCGNWYGRYGPATNCDMFCSGDPAQNCGGAGTNLILQRREDGMLTRTISNMYLAGAANITRVRNPSCATSVCANQCRQQSCAGFNFRNLKIRTGSCLCELIKTQNLTWSQYSYPTEPGSSFWRSLGSW